MQFYALVILIITIPYFSKYQKKGLIWSMVLLFVLWGLEFEIVNDWTSNLFRWKIANEGFVHFHRNVEPLLLFLMKLAKPIGFFGWLIICAIFNICILYYCFRKFIPPKYYWLSLFWFMTSEDHALLYINSNRQTLSIFFSIIAVILIIYSIKVKDIKAKLISYSFAVIMLIGATNIHTGSILSFIFLFMPLFIKTFSKAKTKYLLIFFNILFISRFFLDASKYQYLISLILGDQVMYWSGYIEELATASSLGFSIIKTLIYLIYLNLLVLFYKYQSISGKCFFIASIIAIILSGFAVNTLSRTLLFFNFYHIISFPYIIKGLKRTNYKILNQYTNWFLIIVLLYLSYIFFRMTLFSQFDYYMKWIDFKTIFQAPNWR